ncbi:MAG: 30S ribosomal protein S19, partial [Bacilli bacterium]
MARSLKKGAFVDESLMKKVERLNASHKKEIIKT